MSVDAMRRALDVLQRADDTAPLYSPENHDEGPVSLFYAVAYAKRTLELALEELRLEEEAHADLAQRSFIRGYNAGRPV
jgi:hypothetical protein